MTMRTRCGHCGKVYNMRPDHMGKTAQCKQCHNSFVMTPMPEGPPATAAPPRPASAPPPPPQAAFAPQAPPPYAPQPQAQPPYAPQPSYAPQPQAPMGNRPGQNLAANAMPSPYNAPPPPNANAFGGQAPQAAAHGGARSRGPVGGALPQQRPAFDPSLQTVVCPKCNFSASIPPIGRKIKLRCQECGKTFIAKPDANLKKMVKGTSGGSRKNSLAVFLVVIVLLVAVLFVGPTFLPGIIPNLLPF